VRYLNIVTLNIIVFISILQLAFEAQKRKDLFHLELKIE